MILETIWFRAACLGFFPHFPHYFIFFLPFLGILLFLEEFWTFLEKKGVFWPFGGFLGLLEAFYMVLWPFGGIFSPLEAF